MLNHELGLYRFFHYNKTSNGKGLTLFGSVIELLTSKLELGLRLPYVEAAVFRVFLSLEY